MHPCSVLTELDESILRNYPELLYSGEIPEDADEMDYVKTNLKGKVIA